MGLTRSERDCFRIRIQKNIFLAFIGREKSYTRYNSLNIKQTTGAKLSLFVIYIEVIIYLLW